MGDLLSAYGYFHNRLSGRCAVFVDISARSRNFRHDFRRDKWRAISLEKYQLRNRSRGFDEAWRAVIGRELEKALRSFLSFFSTQIRRCRN